MVKTDASANFSIFHYIFGPNVHLNHAITFALAFEYSCDVSKIIYEAIRVFWSATASTRPYLKACRMSKNWVRQPIFVYFHHIVALICILNHYLYLLSIV